LPKCRNCGADIKNGNQCVYCGSYFETFIRNEEIKEQINNDINRHYLASWISKGMDLMEPVEKYEYEKSFDSLILFRVGLPQELTNNCIAAIDCYNKALEIDPMNAVAMMGKAWALTYLREFNKAEKCCDDLIKCYPNDSFSWVLKGNILKHGFVWGHDIQKAYLCYKKALEIDPTDKESAAGLDNAGRRRPLRNMIPIFGDYLP